jgi:transcriptional regulator with PAS, ATPase and Fis domain
VVTLNIPPLRDRKIDIEPLVEYFIDIFNCQFGQQVRSVEPGVLELFYKHKWPGNVRELQNVIERAFNVIDGDTITKKHLPLYLQEQVNSGRVHSAVLRGLPFVIAKLEREAIIEALTLTNGNRNKAASILNISRAGFYKKMKEYDIKDTYKK